MQLVINTPASAVTATEIKWVAKGGSSISDANGRFALRKNSKGVWRLFDGGILVHESDDKDSAKAYAAQVAAAGTVDLKSALTSGEAKVYSLRSDGTMRRRHFLTGADLEVALNVRSLREKGTSMGAIAGELHVSVSAVRRVLVDLAITEELQEMDNDSLAAMLAGAAETE